MIISLKKKMKKKKKQVNNSKKKKKATAKKKFLQYNNTIPKMKKTMDKPPKSEFTLYIFVMMVITIALDFF